MCAYAYTTHTRLVLEAAFAYIVHVYHHTNAHIYILQFPETQRTHGLFPLLQLLPPFLVMMMMLLFIEPQNKL